MNRVNDNIIKGRNSLFILYEFAILLLSFASFQLSFTWPFPITYIRLLAATITVVFWMYNRDEFLFDRKKVWICFLFTLLIVYRLFFVDIKLKIEPLLSNFMFWICGMSVILSSLEIKRCLLKLFTKSLGVILAFSVPGWILYLCGFPLPHGPMFFDGTFYIHTNYYLFQVNSEYKEILHRFASVFQEPGHLATTCVFIMCINRFNFRKWEVVLMLAATLLSLSLAGYGLLFGTYGLYLMVNSRHRVIYLTIFGILVAGITMYAFQTKKQNGVLYEFIFSRLEFSGGKMKGNNRFSDEFKLQYRYFTEKDEAWWGVGKDLNENGRLTNWTVGSAGWKRYVVWYGYVGTAITLLLLSLYVTKSREIVCFLVLFIVSNFIRDYPIREYWFYLYVIAMTLLPLDKNKSTAKYLREDEGKEVAVV